jgi:hypothetical protein
MSMLAEDEITEKQYLPWDEPNNPGETLTDDLTTAVDYELHFKLTMKKQIAPEGSEEIYDWLYGPGVDSVSQLLSTGKPAKISLALITQEEDGVRPPSPLYTLEPEGR